MLSSRDELCYSFSSSEYLLFYMFLMTKKQHFVQKEFVWFTVLNLQYFSNHTGTGLEKWLKKRLAKIELWFNSFMTEAVI